MSCTCDTCTVRAPCSCRCAGARSICGREDTPDRVGVLIDVVQPHATAELTVGFGTQGLDGADPCLVSYGVQSISLYVR